MRCHDIFQIAISVVEALLKKRVDEKTVFTMSFRCNDPKVNVVAVWFMVQIFEIMYNSVIVDPIVILEGIVNEINWILRTCNSSFDDAFQTTKMEAQMQIISIRYDT